MGPVEAITTCLRKSFNFSGRASRSEFSWFFAASYTMLMAIGLTERAHTEKPTEFNKLVSAVRDFDVGVLVGNMSGQESVRINLILPAVTGWLSLCATLAATLPLSAVIVRRAHDCGRCGHFALLGQFALAVPALASFLFLMISESTETTVLWGIVAMIGAPFVAAILASGIVELLMGFLRQSKPTPIQSPLSTHEVQP